MAKRYDFVFEITSSSDGFDSITSQFNRENCFYAEGTDLNQFFSALLSSHGWAEEHNETHVHVSLKTPKGFVQFIIPFKGDESIPFFLEHLAKE